MHDAPLPPPCALAPPARMGGFTLLELLITIAIGTVIMAMAIPAFTNTIRNSQRASANNALISTLAYARAEALNRRMRVSVCRTGNAEATLPTCGGGTGYESGWVVFSDANGDNQPNVAGDVLRRQGPQRSGVTIRGNTNVSNRVTYNLVGTATTNGQIAVCDQRGLNDARVVLVSMGGRARSVPGNDGAVTISSCAP